MCARGRVGGGRSIGGGTRPVPRDTSLLRVGRDGIDGGVQRERHLASESSGEAHRVLCGIRPSRAQPELPLKRTAAGSAQDWAGMGGGGRGRGELTLGQRPWAAVRKTSKTTERAHANVRSPRCICLSGRKNSIAS